METKNNKKYWIIGFSLIALVVVYLIYKAISGSSNTVAAGTGAKTTTNTPGVGGLITDIGKLFGLGGTTTTTPAKTGTAATPTATATGTALGCASWTVPHAAYTQVAPITGGYDANGYNACGCDQGGMNVDGTYC
jgi:hypothetical protein